MNANHEPEPRTLNPLFPMNEKLTAYALNELPPDERAEFELQLKADPTLRKQAEEMQAFCAMLTDEVAEDAKEETLTPEQRVSVMRAFTAPTKDELTQAADQLQDTKKVLRPFWRHPAFLVPTALAACVTFALVWQAEQLERMESQILDRTEMASRKVDFLPSGGTPAKPAESHAFPPPQIVADMPAPAPPAMPAERNLDLQTPSTGSPPEGRSTFDGKLEGSKADAFMVTDAGKMSGPAVPNTGSIDSSSLTKSGAGTLEFKSANTYTGGTTLTINGGAPTVALANPVASNEGKPQMGKDVSSMVPANPLIANSSVTTVTSSGVLSGSGSVSTPAPASSPAIPSGTGGVAVRPGTAQPSVVSMGGAASRMDVTSVPPVPGNATVSSSPVPQGGFATPNNAVPSLHSASEVAMANEAVVGLQTLTDNLGDDDNSATRGRDKALREPSNESYTRIQENPFLFVAQQPLSTFSIDVDTASYANVRRFLNEGQRPPADAVRIEELINYFPYAYEGPSDGKPFGVMVDVAETPWQPLHRLVRVALKGREVQEDRGPANFVFLVDVSGSMDSPDKLPLVQRSLQMLTKQLNEKDRVALVVYAGSSGLVLPSTEGTDKATIMDAISNLKAGGSTNGASGINLAYEEAAKHFVKGGVNRVILCTDGDFNVGVSSPEELQKIITEKAKSRIFLSVLGFGTGNLKDRTMETLADKGNGNYAYIDSLSEARKVLVEQMNGTLVTIAKDVKIQVEFNPAEVSAYRLLGYENRLLAKEDFNNDKKDAGEIGAGHTVTALYEVVPANVKYPDGKPAVDDLKYAVTAPKPEAPAAAPVPAIQPEKPANREMLTVKLRYKQPEGDKSDLLEVPVTDKEQKLADSPRDFQFAASVAGFGMLLRGSEHAGELTWDMVREMALRGKGEDTLGYRGEFLQLIDKASGLATPPPQ